MINICLNNCSHRSMEKLCKSICSAFLRDNFDCAGEIALKVQSPVSVRCACAIAAVWQSAGFEIERLQVRISAAILRTGVSK